MNIIYFCCLMNIIYFLLFNEHYLPFCLGLFCCFFELLEVYCGMFVESVESTAVLTGRPVL